MESLQFPVLEKGKAGAQQAFRDSQSIGTMGLIYFVSGGFFLLIAVGLSLAQWSGFQQGQDPKRFQQQQSSAFAP